MLLLLIVQVFALSQFIVSFKHGDLTSLAQKYIAKISKKYSKTKRSFGSAPHLYGSIPQVTTFKINDFQGIIIKVDLQLSDLITEEVDFVEEDNKVSLNLVQTSAPWNLGRISVRDLPIPSTFTYLDNGGVGTRIYVLDTGIRTTHDQFRGRAIKGPNFSTDSVNDDTHGHGTHVAGIAGGMTFGVAKNSNLISVKVLDSNGQGYISSIIQGLDYVVKNANAKSVINMSLGGGPSRTLDRAVTAASQSVVVVVAAGNSNTDACKQSPARVTNALTVAASTNQDQRASFSNYGSCVDIFAPGVSILSAYASSDLATATMSGTSMAAPHVAGVVSLALSQYQFDSVSKVMSFIKQNSTWNRLSSIGSKTPNTLVYSLV